MSFLPNNYFPQQQNNKSRFGSRNNNQPSNCNNPLMNLSGSKKYISSSFKNQYQINDNGLPQTNPLFRSKRSSDDFLLNLSHPQVMHTVGNTRYHKKVKSLYCEYSTYQVELMAIHSILSSMGKNWLALIKNQSSQQFNFYLNLLDNQDELMSTMTEMIRNNDSFRKEIISKNLKLLKENDKEIFQMLKSKTFQEVFSDNKNNDNNNNNNNKNKIMFIDKQNHQQQKNQLIQYKSNTQEQKDNDITMNDNKKTHKRTISPNQLLYYGLLDIPQFLSVITDNNEKKYKNNSKYNMTINQNENNSNFYQ